MDPVTLIVSALVAGAASAAQDTASNAVKDAYSGLKTLLQRRFQGKPDAEMALAKAETDSDTWEKPLAKAVAEHSSDQEVLALAQQLLRLLQSQQSASSSRRPDEVKSYNIGGDVGAGAVVLMGEDLTNIQHIQQALAKTPDAEDLTQQFKALLEKIAKHPDLDDDTRQLAMTKTEAVAEGLAKAQESPSGLRLALVDAKGWFSSMAGWAWEEMGTILKSEAAQKTLSTISETATKVTIKSLIGAS